MKTWIKSYQTWWQNPVHWSSSSFPLGHLKTEANSHLYRLSVEKKTNKVIMLSLYNGENNNTAVNMWKKQWLQMNGLTCSSNEAMMSFSCQLNLLELLYQIPWTCLQPLCFPVHPFWSPQTLSLADSASGGGHSSRCRSYLDCLAAWASHTARCLKTGRTSYHGASLLFWTPGIKIYRRMHFKFT